jgi:hypothetical protein
MVTQDQLLQHISRRPFEPFWFSLKSGETINITQTNRAVAMPRQLVVTTDGKRLRWIALDEITDYGQLTSERHGANGADKP